MSEAVTSGEGDSRAYWDVPALYPGITRWRGHRDPQGSPGPGTRAGGRIMTGRDALAARIEALNQLALSGQVAASQPDPAVQAWLLEQRAELVPEPEAGS